MIILAIIFMVVFGVLALLADAAGEAARNLKERRLAKGALCVCVLMFFIALGTFFYSIVGG